MEPEPAKVKSGRRLPELPSEENVPKTATTENVPSENTLGVVPAPAPRTSLTGSQVRLKLRVKGECFS